jgi:gliding motility-associated-like protein
VLKSIVLISLFCFCCFNLKSQDFDRNQFINKSQGIRYQYNEFDTIEIRQKLYYNQYTPTDHNLLYNAAISDKNGNLMLYANSKFLYNRFGDSILNYDTSLLYYVASDKMPYLLKDPNNDSLYFLITIPQNQISYSANKDIECFVIDVSQNNGTIVDYKILYKNNYGNMHSIYDEQKQSLRLFLLLTDKNLIDVVDFINGNFVKVNSIDLGNYIDTFTSFVNVRDFNVSLNEKYIFVSIGHCVTSFGCDFNKAEQYRYLLYELNADSNSYVLKNHFSYKYLLRSVFSPNSKNVFFDNSRIEFLDFMYFNVDNYKNINSIVIDFDTNKLATTYLNHNFRTIVFLNKVFLLFIDDSSKLVINEILNPNQNTDFFKVRKHTELNYLQNISSMFTMMKIRKKDFFKSVNICKKVKTNFIFCNGYYDSIYWDFGNGEKVLQYETDSVFHTFHDTGWIDIKAWYKTSIGYDTFNAKVYVHDAPPIQLGADTLICQNKPLNLFADTIHYQTFLWNTNDTSSFLTVNQSGLYYVKASNPYCASYDSIFVETVNCDFQVQKTCFKDTTQFTFKELTLDSIALYQNAQTLKLSIHSEFQYTFANKGQQDIQFKLYKNNLYTTIDVPLKIDTIIAPKMVTDTIICRNTFYAANLNTNDYDSVRWSQANLSWNNVLRNEGEYIYTVFKNDCHYTDTINLYVVNCGINTSGFCLGDSSSAQLNETRFMYNIWILENVTEINNNNNQISVKLNEGYYKNRVESKINKARIIQKFDLRVSEVPNIQFNADSLVCRFSKLNSGIDNPSILHFWQNNTSQFNEIRILESGKYHLMVQKEACIKRDSIELLVQDCECIIYYPDAFSPNSNQINEVFKPVTDCEASDYDITIFNKWGEIIYRSNDYLSGWNGKDSKNRDVMQDYYYYLVKYKSKLTGKILYKKGAVMLLR